MTNIQFRDKAAGHGTATIPKVVLKSPNITMQAKTLYSQLLDFAWYGEAFPGRDRLAEENGVHPNTIDKYIKELKDFGLVTVIQRGFQQTNLYFIESLTDEMVDKLAPVLTTNFVYRDSHSTVSHVSQQRVNQESQGSVNYRSQQNVIHDSHPTVNEIGVGVVGVSKDLINTNTIVATLTKKFSEYFGMQANPVQLDKFFSYLDDGVSHEVLIESWEIARLNGKGVTYALGVIQNAYEAGARTKEQFDQCQVAFKEQKAGHQQSAATGNGGGNRSRLEKINRLGEKFRD